MDDGRRFLRYVMPGLVYGVVTTLLLFIVFPAWTFSIMTSLGSKDVLGIALSSVLASGGLGYIFATAHHWCHWHIPFDKKIIDHSPMINCLIKKGQIRNGANDSPVDRREALVITLSIWYQHLDTSNPIGNADKKISSLSDLAHAAGTARLASFFGLVTTLTTCVTLGSFSLRIGSIIHFSSMFIFGVCIIIMFHDSYSRVGKIAQKLYDSIIIETLGKESKIFDKSC